MSCTDSYITTSSPVMYYHHNMHSHHQPSTANSINGPYIPNGSMVDQAWILPQVAVSLGSYPSPSPPPNMPPHGFPSSTHPGLQSHNPQNGLPSTHPQYPMHTPPSTASGPPSSWPASASQANYRPQNQAEGHAAGNSAPSQQFKWMQVKRSIVKTAARPKKQEIEPNGTVRTNFTNHQLTELEKEYHTSKYLNRNRRSEIAQMLVLNETQVKIWFQNRRMKEKKRQKEKDFLKSISATTPPPRDTNGISASYGNSAGTGKWCASSTGTRSDSSSNTSGPSEASPPLNMDLKFDKNNF